MKRTVLVLNFALSAFFGSAQNGGYAQGDKLFNIGIGVNSYYNGGIPVGASFELGVFENISVGVNVDYFSDNYNYGNGSSVKFTAMYYAARGSYHVNELLKIANEKIDLYAGAIAGYRTFKWKSSYSNETLGDSYGSGVFIGGYIGGKYYFTNNIGVFTELGAIGSTNVRVGLGFKF